MAARTDPAPAPVEFTEAVRELMSVRWRPELAVEQMPAPQRIAPHSAAVTADVSQGEDEIGTGRLVLLHDPAGNAAWQGTFRLVTFARAEVDPEMITDPVLAEVGWSWLVEALAERGATYTEPSGTVTSVASHSFGALATDASSTRAEVEIRASWTPLVGPGQGLAAHCLAWGDLLCTAAGLPALPEGVVAMPKRRPTGPTR
ncbi:DUF3000 domain-containing protein [Desertihabitans aurantiacus]|uniref:DUF3000 domain-containing protein n=1 Tax=Desertihabitans aurantiacus TaxID=2282477 RepID=UPI000DF74925|nr:DUF3000 domain-containing protein [Desertihabitans aurantiacus]